MSELTKQFGHLQSASHSELGSTDGSNQKYLADSIRNFGKAFGESTLLDRKYELAEKKAREDAEKKRKEEEDLRNKADADRLFALKGGTPLPEKETSWSPAAGNIENLEYANEGLRKQYAVNFATSKINEEQVYTDTNAEKFTDRWYQEFLALGNEDKQIFKNDYTRYASHKAVELKQERFRNLNGLQGINTALESTPLKYDSVVKAISKQQQTHIEWEQGEFLKNYVATDYQGGTGTYPNFNSRTSGPPKTPKEALAMISKLQGKVNKGKGEEALYSKDQVWTAVIDYWEQHVELAQSSRNPIFNTQDLFTPQSGLELTSLGGGIGKKLRDYKTKVYQKFVQLEKDEESRAKTDHEKTDRELDDIAYGNITDISKAVEEAKENPGSITPEMIENLELILNTHDEDGAFSNKGEEHEYTEARKNITLLRNMIDSNSIKYIPSKEEVQDVRDFGYRLETDIKTTTELRKERIKVIQGKENHYLKTNKIKAIDEYKLILKNWADTADKVTDSQKITSNSTLHGLLRPLEKAHDTCLKEGKCESWNSLSQQALPEKMLGGDQQEFRKEVYKQLQAQSDNNRNVLQVNRQRDVTEINRKLEEDLTYTLKAAQKDIDKLNPTEAQLTSYEESRKRRIKIDKDNDTKEKAKTSFAEQRKHDAIIATSSNEALSTYFKDNIESDPTILLSERKAIKKSIENRQNENKITDLKNQDDVWAKDIRSKLNNLGDGKVLSITDLQTIATEVEGHKWYGNQGQNFLNTITSLINSKASDADRLKKMGEVIGWDEKYREAESSYDVSANNIVSKFKDVGINLTTAQQELNTLESNFKTTNAELLKNGTRLHQKVEWTKIKTKALKALNLANSDNIQKNKIKTENEDKAEKLKTEKDNKNNSLLAAKQLVAPAIRLKTIKELQDYHDTKILTISDVTAKTKFSSDIQQLMRRRKDGTTDKELQRLAEKQLGSVYHDLYSNETNLTTLENLQVTARGDKALGLQEPAVTKAIRNRINEIKKINATNLGKEQGQKIFEKLHKNPILTRKDFDIALAEANKIKDATQRDETIDKLEKYFLRGETRSFNADEGQKKIAQDLKANRFLSGLNTQILGIMNKAQDASINFSMEDSDKAVQAARNELDALKTGYINNKAFRDSMAATGKTKWQEVFNEHYSELGTIESKVQKKINSGNILVKAREADNKRETEQQSLLAELSSLQNKYSEQAHKTFIENLDTAPTKTVDRETGEEFHKSLWSAEKIQSYKDDALVAEGLASSTPKETSQDAFLSLIGGYFPKIATEVDEKVKKSLINKAQEYLKQKFISNEISKSNYGSWNKRLLSYLPKQRKRDNGKRRALETLDSIFGTRNVAGELNPKIIIALKNKGNWRLAQQLQERLRSHFDREWQAKVQTFESDEASYKWATDYANMLISEDETINPLGEATALDIQAWNAGILGTTKKKKPSDIGSDDVVEDQKPIENSQTLEDVNAILD